MYQDIYKRFTFSLTFVVCSTLSRHAYDEICLLQNSKEEEFRTAYCTKPKQFLPLTRTTSSTKNQNVGELELQRRLPLRTSKCRALKNLGSKFSDEDDDDEADSQIHKNEKSMPKTKVSAPSTNRVPATKKDEVDGKPNDAAAAATAAVVVVVAAAGKTIHKKEKSVPKTKVSASLSANTDQKLTELQKEHKKLETNYNKLQTQTTTQMNQINDMKTIVKEKAKQLVQQSNELKTVHKLQQKEMKQAADFEKKALQEELAKAVKQLSVSLLASLQTIVITSLHLFTQHIRIYNLQVQLLLGIL